MAELRLLIDKFLAETDALVPIRNPAYEPPIDRWRASSDCRLELQEQFLTMTSTGADPFIHCADMPVVSGPMAIRFRMRSTLRGPGHVFWADSRRRTFSADRRTRFEVAPDGAWHEYVIPFTSKGVLCGLRIDPGTSEGTAAFDWIRLERKFGVNLKSWEFGEGS